MEQLLNPAVLAMLIPIVAIVGAFWVKIRKMEMQRNGGRASEEIEALHDEVLSLRRRMENVEAIVAADSEGPKINIDDVTGENEKSRESGNENGLKNMLR